MYYFKCNGEKILKYAVSFDKEQIKELKMTIINNCSFIKHEEYKSDYFPLFKNRYIKNFHYTCVGTKEYFEEIRDVYLFSYDEYQPPYLVELINELLEGNADIIDEILKYDISTNESIDDKIKMVNQEFMEIDVELDKRKTKLKELEELLKLKELNKNQQSIDKYHKQLVDLIKFDLVDFITIAELNKVESFLEIKLVSDSKLDQNDNLVKALKKQE